MTPQLATKTDVELVSAGTWAASTGVTTVTRADLEAMLAAHNDGLVDRAPVKLGHVSDLNKGIGDGNPAYGWVVPTRIGVGKNGRDTLFGNLVGMPAMLADIADTAYRRRSVEIAWKVTTSEGKQYRAALVGVALLGTANPAVKGLADIAALYTAGGPDDMVALVHFGDEADRVDTITVIAGLEDNPVASAMLAAAAIAGAAPATLDAMTLAATPADTASIPPAPPTANHDDLHDDPQPREGHTMTKRTDDELRTQLGLEKDADVKAALEAILADRAPADPAADQAAAAAAAAAGDANGVQQASTVVPPAAGTVTPPASVPQSTTPAATPGTPELVTLSAATFAELTQLAEDNRKTRRDTLVNTAFRQGRITGSEVTAFRAMADRDEDGTRTLLASLATKFPTSELGYDQAADAPDPNASAWDDWVTGKTDVPR